MKSLSKSKSVIIIFSILFVIVLAIIIPFGITGGFCKKQLIILKRANFESYFYVNLSYDQINQTAQVSYIITPNDDYCCEEQSSATIQLKIAVVFYDNLLKSGSGINTEYLQIDLKKEKGYEKKGGFTVAVPNDAKTYEVYISYVKGEIYA